MGTIERAAPGALWELPASALVAAIRNKHVSPVEVTEAVLERLDLVNPAINAVVTITADSARAEARAAEAAVMRGDEIRPLHGVPYTLKDLTPTKGIRTTFGSKLFADHVPTADAVLVERLRDAGAVLVGKTNTPDQGCKGVTDNKVFGVTRNPWDLTVTPGGSSGGAAAAVAAGIAPLAQGSDFAGSIRIPAAFCGLVGLKPSDGRVPTYPNSMLWHPVTYCNGPITRTVADAALMLDVISGPDPRDPRSLSDGEKDFAAAVQGNVSLRGTRIAWSRNLGFAAVDPVVTEVCESAAGAFEELGCSVEEDETDFSDAVEAYALLNANRRGALVQAFLPDHADDLDPLMVWRAEVGRSHTATDAAAAEMVQTKIYHRVLALFERYDLLLLPTTPVAAFELGVDYPEEIAGVRINTPFEQLPLTFVFNMSGHPAVSVPAGWTPRGLPVGLQIVGPWRGDRAVLRAAAAYERVRPWAHRWPTLLAQEEVR